MDVPLREMGAGATSTPAAAAAAVQPRWFAWARRRTVRTALLGWWLLCTALGAASIMPYVGLVGWDSQNQLPDTLRGKLALGRWYSYFPRQARGAPTVGMIKLRCTPGEHLGCPASVLTPELQPLLQRISEAAKGRAQVETYAQHVDDGGVASRFVTPDNKATMFLVCCDWELDAEIEALLTEHNPDPTKYWAGITSRSMLNTDSIASVKRDLPLIDSICVPLAFSLVGYMLRSPRLVIVAGCNLVCVIMTTFLALYLVCSAFDMVPDPTQLNFVVIMALGLNFDYSLFLLDRFRTSIKTFKTQPQHTAATEEAMVAEAVLEMLRRVTPVVFSSGLTLTTVFSGFLFLTSGNLVGAGLGCAITVMLCMLVSLTLLPALLLSAPTFFSKFCESQPDSDSTTAAVMLDEGSSMAAESELIHAGDVLWHSLRPEQLSALRTSRTVAIVRLITTHPCNLLTAVSLFAVAIALSIPAMEISLNNDISQTAPRGGMAYQGLAEMGALSQPAGAGSSALQQQAQYAGFVGYTDEFRIVIEATPRLTIGGVKSTNGGSAPVLSRLRRCGLNETAQLARQLQSLKESDLGFRLSPAAIFAAGWARGHAVTTAEAILWASGGGDPPGGYALDTQQRCGGDCFRVLAAQQATPGGASSAATIMSVLLPVNPGSAAGNTFIKQVRLLLRQRERTKTGCQRDEDLTIRYFLVDPQANVVSYDMMLLTFEEFKKMLLGICLLLGLLVGVVLRSAFVPLRLALTLILPLASVFGAAVLVYQDGVLGWVGWSHVAASNVRACHVTTFLTLPAL
jgi:hypothetical protein